MWEPKYALLISVKLGKIGNLKFAKGPGYLSAKPQAKQSEQEK